MKRKTIIFESFSGKQFSDNPKSLYYYIRANYPEYKLYWSFDRRFIKEIKCSKLNALSRFGFRWILVMARAEYWVTNSRLPLWIPKPRHTTYVQTWHGTPLKKLGVDIREVSMPNTNTESYKRNFVKEARKWDYLISPNRYSTEIFKSGFNYQNTILECGYPRNDTLYKDNNDLYISKLKQQFNIPEDKKIVLYAPTWRDNDYYTVGKYKFSLKLDIDKLRQIFDKDYVILIRMHYLVSENFNFNKHGGFVHDVSKYNNVSDLYLVSDVLVTDYSSVFFDFANLKRPILFYAYDLEDYRDNLRGFYFNFEKEVPGPILKTTDDIIYYLKLIRDNKYYLPSNFDDFYERFCYLENGRASERVALCLFEKNRKGVIL